MRILISYKLDQDEERSVILKPEEYFLPIEADETYEQDAIPRFDHAINYLKVAIDEVESTAIQFEGGNGETLIRTSYYNRGTSSMTHISDATGYEEIIFDTMLKDHVASVIRTHRNSNRCWEVTYNGVITDLPDGSQVETRIV